MVVTRNKNSHQKPGVMAGNPQENPPQEEEGNFSRKIFWGSAAVSVTSLGIPIALGSWEKARVMKEIKEILDPKQLQSKTAEEMKNHLTSLLTVSDNILAEIAGTNDEAVKRALTEQVKKREKSLQKVKSSLDEMKFKEMKFISDPGFSRSLTPTITYTDIVVTLRSLTPTPAVSDCPYMFYECELINDNQHWRFYSKIEIPRSIWAYVLSAVTTCSFISAFVCFLLTWRQNCEKRVRVIAAVVLLVIAFLYCVLGLTNNRVQIPFQMLLTSSCGIMMAFVWAYQKLAWLRGIIGAVLLGLCEGMIHLVRKDNSPFEGKIKAWLTDFFAIGIFSSFAFTLLSFIFACCCCCPSWKDDGDADQSAQEGPQGPPNSPPHDSKAGDGQRRKIQQTGPKYGATGTDQNV